MVEIAAFRGLRYDQAVAGPPLATSAPAYEDIEAVDHAAHRTANPYTVLELLAPGPAGRAAASETLDRWLRTGVLRPEPGPVLYRYEQHELRGAVPAVQRGVLAAVRVEPLGRSVLPHERVDPERLDARRRRLEQVRVEPSPVFALTTRPVPVLQALLGTPPTAPPVTALTDERGTDHRLWVVDDTAAHRELEAALAEVPVMIADGHHRYAAALAAGVHHTLMFIVDPHLHGPQVRGIHRLVEPVTDAGLERLGRDFTVEPHGAGLRGLEQRISQADTVTFGLLLVDGRQLLLTRPDDPALDAAVFHDLVLPALDGPDVAYRTDLPAAAAELAHRSAAGLFVLRAPDLPTMLSLALAGELLPPKSSSFSPKPRTGLVLHLLTD